MNWRDHLETERTDELKRKSFSVIAFNLPVLFSAEFVNWSVNSGDILSRIFFLLLLVVPPLRFYHVRYSEQSPQAWQRTTYLFAGAMGVGWAGFFLRNILLSQGDATVIVLNFLFGLGLMTASVFSLAISKPSYRCYSWPIAVAMAAGIVVITQGMMNKAFGLFVFASFTSFGNIQRGLIEAAWVRNVLHAFELQSLVDSFPGGILVVSDGTASRVNQYFLQITGTAEPSAIYKTLLKSPLFSSKLSEFTSTPARERVHFEDRMDLGAGERTYWFHLVRSEARARDVVIVALDIQEKKNAEEQIENQRLKLETSAKLAALGEMAGGIAHEVNNPVFVISSRVQLMLMKLEHGSELERAFKPHLDIILSTCDRIVRIVRGLRSMTRGAQDEAFETLKVKAVIEQTVDLCESRLLQTGAKLELGPFDEKCSVEVRPIQFSQVILNLLNNAFDAIEGTENPWIRIHSVCRGEMVEISVTNSGPGIPLEIQDKIMDPFFTTKPIGKGTGLGLSISSGIMKAHHGTLLLDNQSPHTRFIAQLPKAR